MVVSTVCVSAYLNKLLPLGQICEPFGFFLSVQPRKTVAGSKQKDEVYLNPFVRQCFCFPNCLKPGSYHVPLRPPKVGEVFMQSVVCVLLAMAGYFALGNVVEADAFQAGCNSLV